MSSSRRAAITIILCVGLLAAPTAAAAEDSSAERRCTRDSSPTAPQPGKALSSEVAFTVLEAPNPINLGDENF